MVQFNVIKTYIKTGFKEYFLARKTALLQLIILPVIAPLCLLLFTFLLSVLMINNMQIDQANGNIQEESHSSVIGVVMPSDIDITYYRSTVTSAFGMLSFPTEVRYLDTPSLVDEALINEQIHAAVVFNSLAPLSIEIRHHSSKQTLLRYLIDELESYDFSSALMPLRKVIAEQNGMIVNTKAEPAFQPGDMKTVTIGEWGSPVFVLIFVGIFWVGAVMYPVSLSKMNFFHNNDISSDELSHCLSLNVNPLTYVLSRLSNAMAVYVPASLIMCGIVLSYILIIHHFLLSPFAAAFYASEELSGLITQFFSFSTFIFSENLFLLPSILVTLGLPMLLMNLIIHLYVSDDRTALIYSGYIDAVSYGFPALAAVVSASIPTAFSSFPLIQQYYLLRGVIVGDITETFVELYLITMLIYSLFLILVARFRAFHPKRFLKG